MKNRLNLQMSQGHGSTPKPKVRFLMLFLPVLWMFFTVSLNAQNCTEYILYFGPVNVNNGMVEIPVMMYKPPTDIESMNIQVDFSNDNIVLQEAAIQSTLNASIASAGGSIQFPLGSPPYIRIRAFTAFPFSFTGNPIEIELCRVIMYVPPGEEVKLSFSIPYPLAGAIRVSPGVICDPLPENMSDTKEYKAPAGLYISGEVEKWDGDGGGAEIPDVHLKAQNIDNPYNYSDDDTNTQGEYMLDGLLPGGDFEVTVSKTGLLDCGGGVDGTDAMLLQKHLMDADYLNESWQYIAADVTDNGLLTLGDLIGIIKLDQYGHSPLVEKSWAFMAYDSLYAYLDVDVPLANYNEVPEYNEAAPFENLTTNLQTQYFFGIKIGDVGGDGCMDLSGQKPGPIAGFPDGKKSIRLKNIHLDKGEEGLIPVHAPVFKNQALFLLGLQFASDKVALLGIENGHLPEWNEETYSLNYDEPGALDMVWFSMQPEGVSIKPNKPLFFIKVRALEDIKNLHGLVELRHQRMDNKIYSYTDKEEHDLEIEIDNEEAAIPNILSGQTPGYAAVTVSPNPFADVFNIQLILDQEETLEIQILDMNGKSCYYKIFHAVKGENILEIAELTDLPPGYYSYRLKLSDRVLSGKIVKVNK
ncbi:MAG: T9SS type A sorting domain-containing protein [Bacteroidetes bacterium]|nr:T9SS type A sorting domain-containing protein [Bacteroidota bacterium]